MTAAIAAPVAATGQQASAEAANRERRKQHLHGMEQAIDELSHKLRELMKVEQQNQQLQVGFDWWSPYPGPA